MFTQMETIVLHLNTDPWRREPDTLYMISDRVSDTIAALVIRVLLLSISNSSFDLNFICKKNGWRYLFVYIGFNCFYQLSEMKILCVAVLIDSSFLNRKLNSVLAENRSGLASKLGVCL